MGVLSLYKKADKPFLSSVRLQLQDRANSTITGTNPPKAWLRENTFSLAKSIN